MTVTVGAYSLCDGTLPGGVAVSELRVAQRRIADIVPILPAAFRIQLSVAGTGYVVGDLLDISDSGQFAVMLVTVVGGTGDIVNFTVQGNTFTDDSGSLAATGGSGSGAEFIASKFVQPNTSSPKTYDRIGRPCIYSFIVKRTHADADSAEQFIIRLEDAVPSAGTITVTTSDPTPAAFDIPNAKVQSIDLVQQIGATTFHNYSIIGGPPPTET